jgi:hypothetical protein
MRLYIFLFILTVPALSFGQSSYAPLNEDYYHWVDRYEIKTGKIMPQLFTTIKPYKRSAIVAYFDSLKTQGQIESVTDQFNYDFFQNDNWEWSDAESTNSSKPVLKHFYTKKADLFSVDEPEFDLHVNPVLYVGAGKDSREDDMQFINTRGVEVRGMVDRKVGFYTFLTDNQALLPGYVYDYISQNGVVPHEGFWKQYKEGRGVDFLQARGYINFEASKHIGLQFGHDRNFIGNGYRSLIFSDFAPPTWFIKGNVKVWKLNYLFMVNQMTAENKGDAGGFGGYPSKFNALHHLSINIGKKFNLGVFESVIFSADDTLSGADHFRLDYLNPIIFYRAVEQQNGSSDNVILGLDFKWNAIKKLSFYGQFVLDEFKIEHIKAQDGWWANKFGIQLGGKYIDAFGVSNLDLQGEINVVRPYTYSHGTNYGNYSSYRQAIAHPLGANFEEVTGIIHYQPLSRLNLVAKLSMINIGRDSANTNYGSNVLKNNQTRKQELNNKIGQGASNDILFGTFTASWQLKHNLFIDGNIIIRQSKSDLAFYNNNTTLMTLALRWNIARRLYEF